MVLCRGQTLAALLKAPKQFMTLAARFAGFLFKDFHGFWRGMSLLTLAGRGDLVPFHIIFTRQVHRTSKQKLYIIANQNNLLNKACLILPFVKWIQIASNFTRIFPGFQPLQPPMIYQTTWSHVRKATLHTWDQRCHGKSTSSAVSCLNG